jgi:LacI family transcriptional regulator
VEGPKNLLCSRARLDGYRAALESAGMRVDRHLIEPGEFTHESGFAAGGRLLDREDRPSAIFASSDQMAMGVYEAARLRGIRVPDDLSVVGFDDLPEARWSAPPLTTVRQPLVDMGALAARTILRLSRGEPIETPRVEFATELVVRDSTAAVRPGA